MVNRKHLTIAITAAVLIILDQLTKLAVMNNMNIGETIPLITNVLHLTYVQNNGAGFGIMQGQQWLFITLSIILLIAIGYYYKKIPDKISYGIVTGMIIAGVIGNLIDRLSLGYVIDFIDFKIWPVFNVADSCMTIAVVLLVVESLRKNK
jgi:signal peptidase II